MPEMRTIFTFSYASHSRHGVTFNVSIYVHISCIFPVRISLKDSVAIYLEYTPSMSTYLCMREYMYVVRIGRTIR